ncbi:MAG: hypothetical protein PVI86_02520, partial [Phycisphaerae bacterium]
MPLSSKPDSSVELRAVASNRPMFRRIVIPAALFAWWLCATATVNVEASDTPSTLRSTESVTGHVEKAGQVSAAPGGPRLTLQSDDGTLVYERVMGRGATPAPLDTTGIDVCASSGQDINFNINATWQDENGSNQPLASLGIAFIDLTGSDPPPIICIAITDQNGQASASFGPRGGGDGRFILVVVSLANDFTEIQDAAGDTYSWDNFSGGSLPGEFQDVTSGNFNLDINFFNNGAGSLYDAITRFAPYTSVIGIPNVPTAIVRFPVGPTEYDDPTNQIRIDTGDRFQWDVVHALYAHFLMDVNNMYVNPSGCSDFFFGCYACSNDKLDAVRQAWVTGYSAFFAVHGQVALGMSNLGIPRVGDTVFQDASGSTFAVDIASDTPPATGETNSLAIARLFWQLTGLTGFLENSFPLLASATVDRLSEAWEVVRANFLTSVEDQFFGGALLQSFDIGPTLLGPLPPPDPIIVRPGDSFSWTGAVGCVSAWEGDLWRPVFYPVTNLDPLEFASGQALSTSTANPRPLPLADYMTLVNKTHFHVWAADGFNTDSPQTGPYMGDTSFVILNQVPICDPGGCDPETEECEIQPPGDDNGDLAASAGLDPLGDGGGDENFPIYFKECEGPRTSVQLDGTDSFDPDGDELFYQWTTTCPNGVFDDATSATPILTLDSLPPFPLICAVTLEVSDTIESAQCTAIVAIIDTTPPEITLTITNPDQPISVDGLCNAVVEFEVLMEDRCCADPSSVEVVGGITIGEATLGEIVLDPLPPSAPTVLITGRTTVSDLKCCPVRLTLVASGADCSANPGIPSLAEVDIIDDYPPIGACGLTHDHSGWNWVNNTFELTANQPTYWGALSGEPWGTSSFDILDPGWLPGRPDPDSLDSPDRVLRGYVIAFAVDKDGREIRWNHLKGDAVLVNYREGTAWEYNAYAFQAHNVAHGSPTGTPGELHLDGTEYDTCFDKLLMDVYAVHSTALSGGCDPITQNCTTPIAVNTDLTLFPVSVDLR